MPNREWSRDELRELVRGKEVCGRDSGAAVATLPAWLSADAGSILEMDSAESLAALYPDDRSILIDSFVAALGEPGVPQTVRVRSLNDRGWSHVEITWLNLLAHDEVGCLLCIAEVVEGPPIVAPSEQERGGHSPTNWMVMALDRDGEIVSVEGRLEDILGYRREEVVGRHPTDFLSPDGMSDSLSMWLELRSAAGNVSTSRRPWVRRDGREVWLEVSYLNREDTSPEQPFLAVAWDITARRQQEQELMRREAEVRALAEDFRLLADEVPAAVFRCDDTGLVLFHNARWGDLFRECDGFSHLHDVVAGSDRPALDTALRSLSASPDQEQRTLQLTSHDGRSVWGLTLRSVGDTSGRTQTFVGSLRDDTATVALQRRARHDPLTGLLNRQALEESLAEALVTECAETLVLFVDLDGFKTVNDTYGHQAGDQVLAEVARRLTAGLRPGDRVGRYGGDEFVAVCRLSASDDEAIRDRLLLSLGGPIDFPGGSWQPTASIGIARPVPGDHPKAVLRRADLAMFAMKRSRSAS